MSSSRCGKLFALTGSLWLFVASGYDLAGNRLYDRVFQVPYSTYHDNDRSWAYGYDGLHRLISASMGSLSADNSSIQPAGGGAPVPRTTTWNLDNLGNWTRAPEAHGRQITGDFNGDGEPDWSWEDHMVNAANEIIQRNYGSMDPADPVTHLNDPAGNLAFDGQFVYQYDAWNRLIQVNAAGTAALPADGKITDAGQLGALVCRYTYDGLGRLICKENPVEMMGIDLQRKDLYYDGVRRIQEVIMRPNVIIVGGPTTQPDPGDIENDELPAEGGGTEAPQPAQPWTDREYVYGPEYVDEFVCQIAPTAVTPSPGVMYMLQDGNYNVVALAKPMTNDATVIEQYTYDPYGEVVAREATTGSRPVNRVGHQGLFFERFDGSYTEPSIASNIAGLYYNRNRFYSPTLGRFITRDPNETGMPILTALAMNGQMADMATDRFGASDLYGDGMNLYQYQGGNPINRQDPLGLEYDDFDEASDDLTANRAAAIGYIQEGSGWSLVGIGVTLDIAGSLLGLDLLHGTYNIVNGNGSLSDYITVAAAAAGGSLGWKAIKWMRKMYSRGQARATSVTLRVLQKLCFVSGTLVLMGDGSLQPIELIQPGDQVLCDCDPERNNGPEVGTVVDAFQNTAPEVLDLVFESQGMVSTLTTTPGHPFYVAERQTYVAAGNLRAGQCFCDERGAELRLLAIGQRPGPVAVYNFEVTGAHNYFVCLSAATARILVHNSCPFRALTHGNFRYNLQALTDIDPGAAARAHHVFPVTFESKFKRRGINIHDPKYGTWWETHSHQSNWSRWNERWREVFEGNPSREELLDAGKRIARDFNVATHY